MLGRPLTSTFPAKQFVAADAPVRLSVRGLSAPGVTDATFDLRAGEILGVAGLVGAGRTELARALYGAARVQSGTAQLDSGESLGRSPRRSLDAGLVMIPESRKDDGLIFGRSVVENATLSRLGDLSAFGVVMETPTRTGTRPGSPVRWRRPPMASPRAPKPGFCA